MTYARDTEVPIERSRLELERTLARYGADAFMYGWGPTGATVQFRLQGRHVRFDLPLPDPSETRFVRHSRGRRSPEGARREWEQACRSRWRALNLVVKAKLEAVEAGIAVFEEEFLAYVVLPTGQTTGEWIRPQIQEAYESGEMPERLALALTAGRGS